MAIAETGQQPSPPHQTLGPLDRFIGKFAVLKGATRELWLVFMIKFVGCAAYKIMNMTLVLLLSSDFGYSDTVALRVVAAWSVGMTACTLLVGSLTDAIGLRRTFFLGITTCILARALLVFGTVEWLGVGVGLVLLAIGEALSTPVMIAAVRKYSTTKQRSISFSIFYAMMNVGFLVAAYLFDWIRQGLGEYGQMSLLGLHLSTYRTLLLVSMAIDAGLLLLIYFLRPGAEATDEGLKIVPSVPKYPDANILKSLGLTVRDSARDTARLFSGLLRQTGFYRLLAFLMLIAFIKLIGMTMDYVFPKFGIRELGEGAPVGQLWGINNYLVIFLVPFIGALTQRFSAYRMVILGGGLSAASVFIMALPTVWFQPLADSFFGRWLGHWYLNMDGDVHPYYVMIAVYVVLLSVGEAFYSPRVYEYAAAIAPKGQEASYSALSYVPFLLAKLLIGTFSGGLLERYCPATGPRRSGTLWLILALTTLVAPAGLVIFRKYIRVHEAGREN